MNEAVTRVERPEDDYEGSWHIRLDAWMVLGTDEERSEAGPVEIVMEAEGEEPDAPPTDVQLRQVDWLVANQQALLDAILETALRMYKGNRLDMVGDDEDDDDLPVLHTPTEIMPLLRPSMIYLNSLDGGELPYVGIDMNCDWDPEHGLGLMFHGLEIVDVSGTQHLELHSARSTHDHPWPAGHLPDPDGYGQYA